MNLEQAVIKALTDAAISLCEAAQNEAPVVTHDLERSIHVLDPERDGDTISIEIGVDPSELSGRINYAPFVHNGTYDLGPNASRYSSRPPRKDGRPRGHKPNPFFQKALEGKGNHIISALSIALNRAVKASLQEGIGDQS